MRNANFATDLSDAQWAFLEPMLPKPAQTGRPRTPLRFIVDALLYIAKAGCHWHLLPKNFPPYKTVFHVFRAWTRNGTMAGIHDRLRAYAREQDGRRSRPTAAIIDSQTVRSAGLAEEVGYDAGNLLHLLAHLKGQASTGSLSPRQQQSSWLHAPAPPQKVDTNGCLSDWVGYVEDTLVSRKVKIVECTALQSVEAAF